MPKQKVECKCKKTPLTQCVITDGEVSLDSNGKCIGCGRTYNEIKNPVLDEPVPQKEIITLNEEQIVEMKKIHKTLYSFFKDMEYAMCKGLVNGKKRWNTDPAWSFFEKVKASLEKIEKGIDVKKECIDLANFCMMIWHKL